MAVVGPIFEICGVTIAEEGQFPEIIQERLPVVWVQQRANEFVVVGAWRWNLADYGRDSPIEENDSPLLDIHDVNQAGYGFNDSLYERLAMAQRFVCHVGFLFLT